MLMSPTTASSRIITRMINPNQKPFCRCWHKRMNFATVPVVWENLNDCICGEEDDLKEWKWQRPPESESSWVVICENNQLIMFHPTYSSGTAAVMGDTPLQINCHYYWEVKMLTDTYGTDIMIGLGSEKFDPIRSRHKFCSLLGLDKESYGISYTGKVQHDSKTSQDSHGFCKGSIVGLRLDMWQGTLEFYINRQSQGISFYNLRRHSALYPVVCSTAAQSCMKLVYAASWRASLMVDALKILAASVKEDAMTKLPPGLWNRLKPQFWLTMPSKGCPSIEDDVDPSVSKPATKYFAGPLTNEDDIDLSESEPAPKPSMLGEFFPYQYMNGYYVDNVEPNYRMVLWEEIAHE